tara:strand:+ start:4140 stop:4535 length:396 start_codon:yes stop_codon:yes gene_type:complete
MTEYDNTNSGALFNTSNQKLLRSGPVNVEGSDETLCIIQTETKNGKTIFEVYQKVGAIFTNDKKSENSPDVGGTVTLSGTEYFMNGWKKQSKNGNNFTSISLKQKDEQPPKDEATDWGNDAPADDLDEIPF